MRVIVANRPKTPIECLDPRIKSLNYLNNILAKCEAIDFGCDEAIMLNMDGYVTEGSGDNIFIIKNGVIYTPPSDAGILEGVTRGFVAKRAGPGAGLKCVEKNMRLDDVLAADEVVPHRHGRGDHRRDADRPARRQGQRSPRRPRSPMARARSRPSCA
jgi:branched-chain amino acid aminotransferase